MSSFFVSECLVGSQFKNKIKNVLNLLFFYLDESGLEGSSERTSGSSIKNYEPLETIGRARHRLGRGVRLARLVS